MAQGSSLYKGLKFNVMAKTQRFFPALNVLRADVKRTNPWFRRDGTLKEFGQKHADMPPDNYYSCGN
jgi:hypothetical protein